MACFLGFPTSVPLDLLFLSFCIPVLLSVYHTPSIFSLVWGSLYLLPWAPCTGLLFTEDGSLLVPAALQFSRLLSKEYILDFRASSVLSVMNCCPISSSSTVTDTDDMQVLWFLLFQPPAFGGRDIETIQRYLVLLYMPVDLGSCYNLSLHFYTDLERSEKNHAVFTRLC